MGAKKKAWGIFLTLMLLSLAYSASALENFRVTSSGNVNLCPCSNQAYAVEVENTGTEASDYGIIAANMSWFSFSPSRFSLAPGQKGKFLVVVNSECNIEGIFGSELFIATEKGLAKSIKQKLNFSQCYDYGIRPGMALGSDEGIKFYDYNGPYRLCRNEKKTIPVLLENREKFGNSYIIKLDAPEWSKLSLERTKLDGKKSGLVLVQLDTSGVEEGEFQFNLDAVSELGKVQRKSSFEVNVGECYKLELNIEDEKDIICSGEIKNYEIEIKNLGARDQTVLLSIEGAEWAGMEDKTVFVHSEDKELAFLSLSPEDISGKFSIKANAQAENSDIFSDKIQVEVVPKFKCYNVEVKAKQNIVNRYERDFFFANVKNSGIRKTNYTIALEGISWATISPENIELNPGEAGNINIELNPEENLEEGSYNLKVILESEGSSYSKDILVKVKKKNKIIGKIEEWIWLYRYYLYLLLALLVVLAIFFRPIKKRIVILRKRYEKYRIKKQMRKERMKEMKLEEEKKSEQRLESKEFPTKKTNKHTQSKWKKKFYFSISFLAFLAVFLFAAYYFGFLAIIRDFFILYLNYIIAGLAILFIIILLLSFYKPLFKKLREL